VSVEIPDVSISLVSVASVFDELMPLIKSHFLEVSYHNQFELDVSREFYDKMDESGRLKLFVVRHNDKIVGYSSYFLNRHPHVNIIQAYQDTIYLSPDYRGLSIGHKLIEFADSLFKDMGVSIVFNAVSEKVDFSKLLTSMNYQLVDKLYARRLI
jgi:GNAT superfamily N-acetyltransferase